jgi:phosphoenolpyruvate carboxykinase (GTP)
MANLDFISYPIGEYIRNNIRFVEGIKEVPRIYAVNYFLKDGKGNFLTNKLAKKVWLHWAEQRIHNEVDAYRTPLGLIPKHEDLKVLFHEIFGEDFSRELYEELFKFRIDAWTAKISRAIDFYKRTAPDCPEEYVEIWKSTVQKLQGLKGKYGPFIAPGAYKEG